MTTLKYLNINNFKHTSELISIKSMFSNTKLYKLFMINFKVNEAKKNLDYTGIFIGSNTHCESFMKMESNTKNTLFPGLKYEEKT